MAPGFFLLYLPPFPLFFQVHKFRLPPFRVQSIILTNFKTYFSSLTKVSIPSFPAAIGRDTATTIAGSPEESKDKRLPV